MMIRLGNFLFHYRNGLFPIAYLLFFLPAPTVFGSDTLAAIAGLIIASLGQLLRAATIGLAYIRRGGKNRQVYADTLVTEGLFSHCRNPLYVGNFMIIVGLAVAANSWLSLFVAIPFFVIAYWAIIAAEENYLRGKFGKEFDDYCARVHRLVPRLSGLGQTLRSMEFQWSRLLVKEYGSAFAWMAGMILIVMKDQWLHRGFDAARGVITVLAALLVAVILAYVLARVLKKTRIVRAG